MSRENLPVLGGAIKSYEYYLTALERCKNGFFEREKKDHPAMRFVDTGLKWGTKYYCRMDCSKAYVIAMCKCLISTKNGFGCYQDTKHTHTCGSPQPYSAP